MDISDKCHEELRIMDARNPFFSLKSLLWVLKTCAWGRKYRQIRTNIPQRVYCFLKRTSESLSFCLSNYKASDLLLNAQNMFLVFELEQWEQGMRESTTFNTSWVLVLLPFLLHVWYHKKVMSMKRYSVCRELIWQKWENVIKEDNKLRDKTCHQKEETKTMDIEGDKRKNSLYMNNTYKCRDVCSLSDLF